MPETPALSPDPHKILDHLFRRESGKMVAVVTRMLGIENLAVAEDIVQETLVRALRQWSFGTVPENPAGWLMRSAKNLAVDHIRRQRFLQWVEPSVAYHIADVQQPTTSPDHV